MNVAKLLEKRRSDWTELEQLCEAMELRGRTDSMGGGHRGAAGITRFASLYRAACADLALADAYQLPPNTVTYLHRLVARAHNQLYRTQSASPTGWIRTLFDEAPQRIFNDGCVRVATLVFFGLFALSMMMGAAEEQFPEFAENVCGTKMLKTTQESFSEPLNVAPEEYSARAAFYIRHNTGIGLQCFAWGILLVPCLYTLAYNAVVLGATFGYMSRDGIEGSDHFFEFVTAHGPFELTAIALSAAGGLRLGMGLFYTRGMSRVDSIRESGREAVPVMAASATMFILAAFTEGFLSPSGAPYLIKVAWSILSSALITLYFVILGFPRQRSSDRSLIRTARYSELVDHSTDAVSPARVGPQELSQTRGTARAT
ncbi:stage II sporulation protein M [Roseiconus lacunae]|uniref:Stage II sporulation protein M n=1 Tax=Roseiconus lacunae TaxID=2605694 RepID=A0ABT7PKJ9_9BACT|nr:stage II sporulation protein M [Roseiconus lacunae]MCD0461123.1 stage II sporulation protein M [Roseiconus lacunae]MDM4017027.1 stage II sporulation protein M [Roseiconus lacunae]WRQ48958.1 stage II sporulation protein M [Stieleria sp. HD01]